MRQTKSKRIALVNCRLAIKSCKSVFKRCFISVLLFVVLIAGCSYISPWAGGPTAFEDKLSAPYDHIQVKRGIIHDAVPKIQRLNEEEFAPYLARNELISHSENVVVSLGQSEDGFRNWFNMVTFHKNELSVERKYFFFVNDKTRSFQIKSGRGLRFDCEAVLGKEAFVGGEKSENARRISVLKNIRENLQKDMDELGDEDDSPDQGNQMLEICRLLINQTFEVILRKLENSPIQATRLSQSGGVEFEHINFDKGKIQMFIRGDVATVNIRLGAFADRIDDARLRSLKRASRKPSFVPRRY
jgi:hypothetical protein